MFGQYLSSNYLTLKKLASDAVMTDSPQIVSTDSTDVAMISGNKSVVIEDFLNSATVIGLGSFLH